MICQRNTMTSPRKRLATTKLRPFMGVDGEGCGVNRHGQQHYKLLCASRPGDLPYELFTGKRLTTRDCLNWICNLPPEPLLVGFGFGYDATQILRDLPSERLDRLFADKEAGPGQSRYTYFGDYAVEYLPKNYLRVCRTERGRITITDDLGNRHTHNTTKRVEGTTRTIYETFGFFQMSFLKALHSFDVGREHLALIERNKANRSEFVRITREIRRYCQLECELLAELMERFRAVCHANDLRPRTWNGAGKLAAAEHDRHGTITAAQIAGWIPPGVLQMAADAYYGGRFEVTRIGEIAGPIYEYDIGSAYPSAMRSLPCLLHGTWEPFNGSPPAKCIHVAYVAFSHPKDAPLCSLPIRKKDGRLFWPREGQGIYWSQELASARRMGARLRYTAGWRYVANCQCHSFDWIEARFAQRRALGDLQGYPVKLALNSLYGKLAQRIGSPRWGNLIWAGMITAITRAQLNDAARGAPDDVLMFATDGVFSRSPLPLPLGNGLGQWKLEGPHKRLFIVQPGIYWGARRPKTRGVPVSVLTEHTKTFEQRWRVWCGTMRGTAPPIVGIPVPLFTGLRLSHARGTAETTAAVWTKGCKDRCEKRPDCQVCREFSFDWSRKRATAPAWEGAYCVRTMPSPGAPDLVSVPHSANAAASYLIDSERALFDEQPDHVDLSPP
jgi:DNA polymerase type B, organellar and viral